MAEQSYLMDIAFDAGKGRIESDQMAMLKAISLFGTLTEAAKQVGVSYKTACAWLDTLNNAAESPLLSTSHGGSLRGGTQLTELGKQTLARYERIKDLHAQMQAELESAEGLPEFLQRIRLRTSARNHLHGIVTEISGGKVQSLVRLEISSQFHLQAKLSHQAVEEMGLELGTRVTALVKAAAVLVEPWGETCSPLPFNAWMGHVIRSHEDGEFVDATLDIDGQHTITALVPRSQWHDIQNKSPGKAMAQVNPSHILLMRLA